MHKIAFFYICLRPDIFSVAEKNSKALFVVNVINRVSLPRFRFKRNSVVPQIWMYPVSPFFQTAHQTVHSPLFFRKTIYVDRALCVMGRPYDFKCTEGKGARGGGGLGVYNHSPPRKYIWHSSQASTVPYYKKVWRHACSLSDSEKSFSLAETKQMKMQLQCHILMLSSLIFKVHCHTKWMIHAIHVVDRDCVKLTRWRNFVSYSL